MLNGILQARILEWVGFPFFRGSSQAQDRTQVCRTAGRFFSRWATREKCLQPAHIQLGACNKPVRLSARGNVSVSVNELNTAESCSLLLCWDERESSCVCSCRASAADGPRLGGSGVSARPTSRPPARAARSRREASSPQGLSGSYSNAS